MCISTIRLQTIAASFLVQVISLGTIGFFIFLSFGWANIGWFWASDILEAWLFCLFIMGLFLAGICQPILWLSSGLGVSKYAKYLTAFSGFLTVFLYMTLFSQFDFSFYRYFVFPVNIHTPFIVVGFLFGFFNQQKNKTATK